MAWIFGIRFSIRYYLFRSQQPYIWIVSKCGAKMPKIYKKSGYLYDSSSVSRDFSLLKLFDFHFNWKSRCINMEATSSNGCAIWCEYHEELVFGFVFSSQWRHCLHLCYDIDFVQFHFFLFVHLRHLWSFWSINSITSNEYRTKSGWKKSRKCSKTETIHWRNYLRDRKDSNQSIRVSFLLH